MRQQDNGTVYPTKRQRENGTYKAINGQWHKKCTGPAHAVEFGHAEGFAWLPATPKYFHTFKSGSRSGKLLARCRLCINWDKIKSPGSYHGYVPRDIAFPIYNEAVNRIGVWELSRRTGVSSGAIERLLNGESKRVRKLTLRKIMLELVSLRRKGESSDSLSLRWRNDRRNNGELGTCKGCGGPIRNVTSGCPSCYERHRRWYRDGKITAAEWKRVRDQHSTRGGDKLLGLEV